MGPRSDVWPPDEAAHRWRLAVRGLRTWRGLARPCDRPGNAVDWSSPVEMTPPAAMHGGISASAPASLLDTGRWTPSKKLRAPAWLPPRTATSTDVPRRSRTLRRGTPLPAPWSTRVAIISGHPTRHSRSPRSCPYRGRTLLFRSRGHTRRPPLSRHPSRAALRERGTHGPGLRKTGGR